MELHYYPKLGAEFFIWEPDLAEVTQVHAAPALDYARVEIESKKDRLYEWVLHHTPAVLEVSEVSEGAAGPYRKVADAARMAPGTWRYDAAARQLRFSAV